MSHCPTASASSTEMTLRVGRERSTRLSPHYRSVGCEPVTGDALRPVGLTLGKPWSSHLLPLTCEIFGGGERNRTAVRGFAEALPGFDAVRNKPSFQVKGQAGPTWFMQVPLCCGITVACATVTPGSSRHAEGERGTEPRGVPHRGLDEPDRSRKTHSWWPPVRTGLEAFWGAPKRGRGCPRSGLRGSQLEIVMETPGLVQVPQQS
jgi:hypothetical protein